MFPLRAIIAACVALRIHPNILTFVGVLINIAAACALGTGRFITAGVIMIVANIFDFIDGKVARELNAETKFGGVWRFQAKRADEPDWTYYERPLMDDLLQLKDVIFRKYQRRRASAEDLQSVEKLLREYARDE
jgi:hypothetical protein